MDNISEERKLRNNFFTKGVVFQKIITENYLRFDGAEKWFTGDTVVEV